MPHTLPNWIERLLGIQAAAGEGTAWSIETVWPWPPWATLLFVIAAAVLIFSLYLRDRGRASRAYRFSLAVVRLALVALAMLMIARATLTLKRTAQPEAIVLLDDSLSMTIVDQSDSAEKPSRWQRLQSLTARRDGELLRKIAEKHRLSVRFLTDDRPCQVVDVPEIIAEIAGAAPVGKSTRLGDAILAAVERKNGVPPSAIILLTDGVNTDGPGLAEAARRARLRGVPLMFVGIGGDRPPPDLAISDLAVDDVVFLDDIVNVECRLTAVGLKGKTATVVLREKDTPSPLAEVDVAVSDDEQQTTVRLPYRPNRVGQFDLVVEVKPLGGETRTANNRQSRRVEVRKEKIRVLLVWAYPGFEFRYLRNMLQRDETISLHTVLQDADPEYARQDAAALAGFPSRRDELFAYDVVILGDADPALLGGEALRNLAEFVDLPAKGGSLILVAGEKFMPSAYRGTPVERLMPFDPRGAKPPDQDSPLTDGFFVRPTEFGLADPGVQLSDDPAETKRIWSELPPLYWLLRLPRPKPAVRVLLEASVPAATGNQPPPVALFQYTGAGKVLFHATDETWRWRYRGGEKYYNRYWRQTIRWLARSKLSETGGPVALGADRREYEQGEPIRLSVRFANERLAPADDDGVVVAVESPDGKTERAALRRSATERGLFQSVLEPTIEGEYRAWLVAPELENRPAAIGFRVKPPMGEFARTRMDAAGMQNAAELSGGRYFTLDAADRLPNQLPPGRLVPVETLPPLPLWNSWPALALFLGLLVAEWLLRKRRGMV